MRGVGGPKTQSLPPWAHGGTPTLDGGRKEKQVGGRRSKLEARRRREEVGAGWGTLVGKNERGCRLKLGALLTGCRDVPPSAWEGRSQGDHPLSTGTQPGQHPSPHTVSGGLAVAEATLDRQQFSDRQSYDVD